MKRRMLGLLGGLLVLSFTLAAAPFTTVTVFGDSLSDNGNNTFGATGYPPWPYHQGRFSNGAVMVEIFAGFNAARLKNYAWGGATTGIGNNVDGGNVSTAVALPGMRAVFDTTDLQAISPGTLFIVWGGSNDFVAPAPEDAGNPSAIATRAVGNLVYIAQGLQAAGASNIWVFGLPDLGLTPLVRSQGAALSMAASLLTDQFNAALAAQIALLPNARFIDIAGKQRAMIGDPAAYGFSNVTDPCLTSTGICSDPWSYFYWDEVHPASRVHSLLALDLVVPEPGTLVLLAGGLAALAALRRTRR